MKKMLSGGSKFLQGKNESKATEALQEDESKEEVHQRGAIRTCQGGGAFAFDATDRVPTDCGRRPAGQGQREGLKGD